MSVVDGSCLLPWLNRYSVGPSATAHLDRICIGSLYLFLSLPEVLIAHLCGGDDSIQCKNLRKFLLMAKVPIEEFFSAYDEVGPSSRASPSRSVPFMHTFDRGQYDFAQH